jgi:hypothetical protein
VAGGPAGGPTGVISAVHTERKSTQNEEINRDEFVKVSLIDFYEKDSEMNIRFDENNKQEIKAVTLVKLIEKVTSSFAEGRFNTTLVYTYRAYTSSMELMNLLKKRFEMEPPKTLPLAEQEALKNDLRAVRLRVFNILKMWVESPFFDWYNGELLKNLEGFMNLFLRYGNTNSANILRSIIEKKLKEDPNDRRRVSASIAPVLLQLPSDPATLKVCLFFSLFMG